MARGRQEDSWSKVSHICACSINANPFLKEPFSAEDFDPFAKKRPLPSADGVFDAMKADGFMA